MAAANKGLHTLCFIYLLIFAVVLVASSSPLGVEAKSSKKRNPLDRKRFPKGFVFGAGSASYQDEGAAHEDGRRASVWDTFTKQHPEKIADGSNADVANDFYHHHKADVKLMKDIGLDSFRFSISWPRILPRGKISGGVNKLGIKFYHNLIDELLANGIKPFVTLFHWDLPQSLQDEYGGFLSPKIVNDFRDYVDLVFKEFGNKVKYWTTLNEPNIIASYGFATGVHAPGRCSSFIGNCTAGNSATEPYVAGHNLLLCHSAAVELYRDKYQPYQKGIIGLVVAANMYIPINETLASHLAAMRAIDFKIGWFLDPVVYGDYPKTMRSLAGKRLPKFTKKQSKLLRKSFDFLGLNYYTSNYAAESGPTGHVNLSYTTDSRVKLTTSKNGVLIGKKTALNWLYVYPKGILSLLRYIREKYNNPGVFITENGVADANNGSLSNDPAALTDSLRIEYHTKHLSYTLKAIKEGANVKGHFVWSFLDNFSWKSGYTIRYGLNFVDFNKGLKRHPKRSFNWFKKFLAKR